jgi:hypothetical protein
MRAEGGNWGGTPLFQIIFGKEGRTNRHGQPWHSQEDGGMSLMLKTVRMMALRRLCFHAPFSRMFIFAHRYLKIIPAFRVTWLSLFFEVAATIGGIVGFAVRLFFQVLLLDSLTDLSLGHLPSYCNSHTKKENGIVSHSRLRT